MSQQQSRSNLAAELEHQLTREWLLTNGRGGFASGTALGVNTRRYHGLLVAAARPPLERWMLLSGVLEKLTIDQKRIELANFEFENAFHPRGFEYLTDFETSNNPVEPFARLVYDTPLARITKRVVTPRGKDEVRIHYTLELPHDAEATFEVAAFVAMRDFHHLSRATDAGFPVDPCAHACIVHAWRGGPRLWMAGVNLTADEPLAFDHRSDWWRGFFYREEAHRGQDCREDLFVPGWFRTRGRGTLELAVTARALLRPELAAEPHTQDRTPESFGPAPSTRRPARAGGAVSRRGGLADPVMDVSSHGAVEPRLRDAADAFVVTRRRADGTESKTILAGYHWFGDWGRDTFIAMPGLLFDTGRFQDALEILTTFAGVQRNGLIPNRFSDYGDGCDYNSVDASLWFLYAATRYYELTDDAAAWSRILYPACRSIIEHFQQGTDFDIRVEPDGLLSAGNPATQLTWMDAKYGNTVFTPRNGKAVEINALWYHALRTLEKLCLKIAPQDAGHYDRLANRVETAFGHTFWNPRGNCLYDVVQSPPAAAEKPVQNANASSGSLPGDADPAGADDRATGLNVGASAAPRIDASIRPNQIFAVSLPHSPLSAAQQQLVVQCVRTQLLTPYGLRSLSPRDPAYHPRCQGSPYERDSAYHQGTVWAWLIGPYVEAHLRISNFSEESKAAMRVLLGYLIQHLDEAGIGSVSEIFDGDPPHTPRGCIAQAWSVAELLRAWRMTTPK